MDAQGPKETVGLGGWSRQLIGSGPCDTYQAGNERWQVRRSASRRWYVWHRPGPRSGEALVATTSSLKAGRQWILDHVVSEQLALWRGRA